MPLTASSGIPASITIGDSVSFTVNHTDYPVADWPTAQLVIRQGSKVQTFTGEIDSLDQLFDLTVDDTAKLTPGSAVACVIYTDADGNRRSTDWQAVTIFADPTAAPVSTFASRSLANIESAIEKLSKGTSETVNFNGQSFTKKDLSKMLDIRDRLQAEVASEQSGLNLGLSRSTGIRVRFALPA